jgi:hypothetical protein
VTGYGFSMDDAKVIASELGIRVVGNDLTPSRDLYGDSRERCSFVLKLDVHAERTNGALPYQRVSQSPASGRHRRVAAVCWHGHRDFMREIFNRFPEARIKSALADYRGRMDFEQNYRSTAGTSNGWNVGYSRACVCAGVIA